MNGFPAIAFPFVRLRFRVSQPRQREINSFAAETPVSFVPMVAISETGTMDVREMRRLDEVQAGYTFFRNNDVVIAKITPCFENGKGAIARDLVNGIGFGTTELFVLRPSAEVDERFLYYFTVSDYFRRTGTGLMYGAGGQKRIPDSLILDVPFPAISRQEQARIADMLDRETAEADALVTKYEQLINLLEEKRLALITQAVTKGLNLRDPMKDSDVELIGAIPEHWKTSRIKFCSTKIGSGVTPRGGSESYVSSGVAFLRSQNVYDDGLRLDDVAYISFDVDNDMSRTRVCEHDILFNITGASIGRTCIVPSSALPANVNQHVCIIRPSNHVVPEYLAYTLKSRLVRAQITSDENGASREGLNYQQVGDLRIAIPASRTEQSQIVEYLDYHMRRISENKAKVTEALRLISERRSTLITAAVTGKIDVKTYRSRPPIKASVP